jgi:uncharacterized phage protein (TIGR01671 family)
MNKNRLEFRAFHKPTHRLFNVYTFSKDFVFEETIDGIGTSETNPARFEDCIIEQCTGLKDKNGKLIFEGDIVHYVKHTNFGLGGDRIAQVSWDYAMAMFYIKTTYGDCYNLDEFDLDIIGNIHENGEILE